MLASLNISHFAEDSDKRQTDSFLCCILPNIRRKNRRNIDVSLGTSALRFEGIALCVAKPLESSVGECRRSFLHDARDKEIQRREKPRNSSLTKLSIPIYPNSYFRGYGRKIESGT